jgi:hypothetical protein
MCSAQAYLMGELADELVVFIGIRIQVILLPLHVVSFGS